MGCTNSKQNGDVDYLLTLLKRLAATNSKIVLDLLEEILNKHLADPEKAKLEEMKTRNLTH